MTTIAVTASKKYEVLVDGGILDHAGVQIDRQVGGNTAVIVSDDNVFPIYGQQLRRSLERSGYQVKEYVFPHGERSKNLTTYGKLLNFLAENHLTRSDLLVALGGGVVGDLTGFAAATYQRGIAFVQIPTTLLAMVDSSVGGKTAVDLDSGKNQVGCFYQPSLVLCDPETMLTLPENEYLCGCAEVIKYAILGNREFFRELSQTPIRDQLEHVITTCVTMKRDVVGQDEFDRGGRMVLNFGHTIGHAVESCSGFSILHGQAVAIGMAAITRAACQMGACGQETLEQVLAILKQYDLPTEVPYSLDRLYQAALLDKKLTGQTMHLVVPEEIGRCKIYSIPVDALRDWMQAGGIR